MRCRPESRWTVLRVESQPIRWLLNAWAKLCFRSRRAPSIAWCWSQTLQSCRRRRCFGKFCASWLNREAQQLSPRCCVVVTSRKRENAWAFWCAAEIPPQWISAARTQKRRKAPKRAQLNGGREGKEWAQVPARLRYFRGRGGDGAMAQAL